MGLLLQLHEKCKQEAQSPDWPGQKVRSHLKNSREKKGWRYGWSSRVPAYQVQTPLPSKYQPLPPPPKRNKTKFVNDRTQVSHFFLKTFFVGERWDKVSLCCPDWPQIHSLPASGSECWITDTYYRAGLFLKSLQLSLLHLELQPTGTVFAYGLW